MQLFWKNSISLLERTVGFKCMHTGVIMLVAIIIIMNIKHLLYARHHAKCLYYLFNQTTTLQSKHYYFTFPNEEFEP